MLTTNMIRKDLSATNQYDAGVALSGLSCFISADLSRDLANDIMTLMSSTKPYLRMKAVLMMYKVFLNNPEALRPAFPKLKEKLEDPDPGVQSAAVNVICELARKNPKNYLSLAPIFFKLMTTSTNNWMLIKIIKLVSCAIVSCFFNFFLSKLKAGKPRHLRWTIVEHEADEATRRDHLQVFATPNELACLLSLALNSCLCFVVCSLVL